MSNIIHVIHNFMIMFDQELMSAAKQRDGASVFRYGVEFAFRKTTLAVNLLIRKVRDPYRPPWRVL